MSEIQQRIATIELKTAIGKNLPSGWFSFVAPTAIRENRDNRDNFYGYLAEFVRDFRTDVWPTNNGLVDERFNGSVETAKATIKARFSEDDHLRDVLSGHGPHILATGALIYAPDAYPQSIRDLHPDYVDAMQLVAVDVSGSQTERHLKHAANITRLGPDSIKHSAYTALFGGVEAREDLGDEVYLSIASKALAIASRGALRYRTQKAYLAKEGLDQRAVRTYQTLGFSRTGEAPDDATFGPIDVYSRNLAKPSTRG